MIQSRTIDMKRRTFIKTATGAAVASTIGGTLPHARADHHQDQQILAWRKYVVETPQQRGIVDRFLKNAAIPGLNRLGSKPIGVFYGEAITGANLPNLTYMIAYKNMEERKAAWGRFSKHPDWQILKKNERYKDTVSKIVQKYLVPASYSQI